ncbi:MAG: hypothetical protein Tsb0010_10950 [Parvularculaceae bacterium]
MRALFSLHAIGFWIFFAVYAYLKYVRGFNGTFSILYTQTVIILLVLTAIIPYFFAYWGAQLGKRIHPGLGVLAAFALALGLCVGGYATYYFAFIAPNNPQIALSTVAPRGVWPGLVMGALAASSLVLHVRIRTQPANEAA